MKFGFIGCGNMASAIINGGLKKGIFTKEELLASVKTEASARKVQDTLGISCTTDNLAVAAQADYLFLAVKPQFCEEVASQISQSRKEGQILVSIAAGKTIAWLKEKFGKDQKIIRTMPNTPALVGEGITGVCPDNLVTEEEITQVLTLLGSFGKAAVVTEPILDIVGAVSGSSPAFVFMFIEALADGAVAEGMARKQAYEFAAQSVLGSAKMVLETGLHPGALKDMVCSPGGTTIEGVNPPANWWPSPVRQILEHQYTRHPPHDSRLPFHTPNSWPEPEALSSVVLSCYFVDVIRSLLINKVVQPIGEKQVSMRTPPHTHSFLRIVINIVILRHLDREPLG